MDWEPTGLRSLPRTGLAVSTLRLGTTAIGGLFEATSDAAAHATFAAAAAAGLRYVDTAPQYRHGLAEQRVGRALRAFERDRFVLATKVGKLLRGQEGLDFHPYCHVVVHWNLPSNPVDLEQREGRVHRYKGHAVRKNIAQAFGAEVLNSGARDPWSAAFELARAGRPAGATDMVPYWLFPLEGGARIERRVPALPLSMDLLRMADLRRTLANYRLVFGQPRQEDLIEFLMSRFDGEQLKQICTELRVDLAPTQDLEAKPRMRAATRNCRLHCATAARPFVRTSSSYARDEAQAVAARLVTISAVPGFTVVHLRDRSRLIP